MSAQQQQATPSAQELLAAGLSEDQIAAVLQKLGLNAQGTPRNDGGLDITPTPAFVAKTTVDAAEPGKVKPSNAADPVPALCKAGTKVFLNLCSHDACPGLKRMNRPGKDGQEEEGIHVPIAVGPLKPEKDNSGNDSLAVDLVVHPSVIGDCDRDPSGGFRHWLVQLALQYVQRKHGLTCSAQYALPKLKYKGAAVSSQRIRVDKPSKIEEVKASGSAAASSPLGILSEAGALPQASTALAMPQQGMRGVTSAAPVSARPAPRPELPVKMDIRVLSEELESEREGMVGQIARQAAEAATSDLGLGAGEDKPSGGVGSFLSKNSATGPVGAQGAGMSVASTRRLPQVRDITVSASVYASMETARPTAGEEEGADTARDEGAPVQVAKEAKLAVSFEQTKNGSQDSVAVIAPPSDWQSDACTLRLTLSLPGAQDMQGKSIRLVGKGSGEALLVSAPGYRSCTVKLPFSCAFVGSTSGGVPQDESGDTGSASTLAAVWDSASNELMLELPRRINTAATLPLLPSSIGTVDPSGFLSPDIASLLLSYVDADARMFEPDPGSRPWLLAQALSSDDAESERRPSQGAGARSSASAAAVLDSSAGEDELPEDRLLRQDALSLHFLQQREAERAARLKKDEERANEPMVKEITFEPGIGQVETPADLGSFGRPATAAGTSGPGSAGSGAAGAGAFDPTALLEDLL